MFKSAKQKLIRYVADQLINDDYFTDELTKKVVQQAEDDIDIQEIVDEALKQVEQVVEDSHISIKF
jgi:Asp-tRNA(Asn)/Glu-tRNA(Gln) amidotransferase B subunit